ncbi:MAG: PAS domain-containing hybrid sensor histidine kinase/response regulator [Pseudomonadota bacterium]
MFDGTTIFLIALCYVGALFAVAWLGDRNQKRLQIPYAQSLIYALSIAVYCTTWTYLGSVGTAAKSGWDFVPIYLGPILMFALGWPLIQRIVRISKAQNVTSVADFLAARYGKSPTVAAVVACVSLVGAVPYIALQLKAILITVDALQTGGAAAPVVATAGGFTDTQKVFVIAALLAAFAALFGTRHIDGTEHQFGLMLAIATESVVKLAAFLAVGLYVTFWVFDGFGGFVDAVSNNVAARQVFSASPNGMSWLTAMFLASVCVLLLPRQFHVIVVENKSEGDVKRAAWLFPIYLVAINIFVVPIAAAGLMTQPAASNPDLFVITVPLSEGAQSLVAFAFIGGLSAATAMVIVEAIAVAILVCNGLIVPLLVRNQLLLPEPGSQFGTTLLMIRRVAIVCVVFLGLAFERFLGDVVGLSAIGLVAFAAIAQLAPVFFLGLVWRGGTARGAVAGILAGSAVWAYTLLLPWIIKAGWLPQSILTDGPLGLSFLKPQTLFFLSFDPLTHGVLWSMIANVGMFVWVSRRTVHEPVERMQSQIYTVGPLAQPDVPLEPGMRVWSAGVTHDDLHQTVARYLGHERTQRSFDEFFGTRGEVPAGHADVDVNTLRFSENLLASAIGAASARLVLSLLLRRNEFGSKSGSKSALRLLDDASEALQQNRDLLQSAIDQVRHGLAVFDTDMRLICWNRQFRELLDLPQEFGRVGVPLDRIMRQMAIRGDFGQGEIDDLVAQRIRHLAVSGETFQEQLTGSGRYIEIRTATMPQGGIVITFADITERVSVANALAEINVTLERRVEERTAELLSLNAALALAKARADAANQDKTRFVAAATHDILQPLNAARLYSTTLVERDLEPEAARIASNIDVSLRSVEDIFGAIMEISRIDAGRIEPTVAPVAVAELLSNLDIEYGGLARERGLKLSVMPSSLWIRTDKRLMRRLLQNLLSNAIKYTNSGRVLIGAKRSGDDVILLVADTGPGIADEHLDLIFKEFRRVNERTGDARGLGLGLSIVDRISGILNADVRLVSEVGRGSVFWVRASRTAAITEAGSAESNLPRPALEGTLVVCIDNEPAILEGMRTLLGNWGCNVIVGPDAATVRGALRDAEGIPNVIFADYHLDGGTGDDAIFKLREALAAEIPGVIITADHSDERVRAVREQGLALLRKPVKAAAVRALLNQYARSKVAAE